MLDVCMFTLGGQHSYIQALCSGLAEVGPSHGVRTCLVTGPGPAPTGSPSYHVETILPRQIPVHDYKSRLHWLCSRLVYLRRRRRIFERWLRGRHVDVVHFQQDAAPLFETGLFRALRRDGIGVAVTIHDIVTNRRYGRILEALARRASRAAWRECDALCVHSEGLGNQLSEFLGAGHPPIHVTPIAISSVPVRPAPAEDTLLFFGILHPYKGLDVLLRAMQRLPGLRLIIAGRPEPSIGMDYMNQIRNMIAMLPEGQVELHDRFIPEEEVAGLFARASLVVIPYTVFSSQSGVLHTALGHGRPVVVSDIGAMGESVRRWGVGEVVPPGDVAGLASGIERALTPARYAAAVEASARVRNESTWARMAQATIEVYRTVREGYGSH